MSKSNTQSLQQKGHAKYTHTRLSQTKPLYGWNRRHKTPYMRVRMDMTDVAIWSITGSLNSMVCFAMVCHYISFDAWFNLKVSIVWRLSHMFLLWFCFMFSHNHPQWTQWTCKIGHNVCQCRPNEQITWMARKKTTRIFPHAHTRIPQKSTCQETVNFDGEMATMIDPNQLRMVAIARDRLQYFWR